MTTVGSYEAKTHLAALLDRVAKGERITITRHGVPVAILEPADAQPRMTVEEAVERIRELGKGKSLSGGTIRELIEEGRRC